MLLKLDEAKRKELVNEYQQLLYDEMPLVMLYNGYSFQCTVRQIPGLQWHLKADVNNQKLSGNGP